MGDTNGMHSNEPGVRGVKKNNKKQNKKQQVKKKNSNLKMKKEMPTLVAETEE